MTQRFSKEWLLLDEITKSKILSFHSSAPVPIGAIASSLGLIVKISTLPVGISGEIRPDTAAPKGFTIKVDRHETKERQRFTLAHEIAHFLLHPDLIKNGLSDDVLYRSSLSNRKEAEANRLAADLVMPMSLIEEWMEQFPNSSLETHIDALAKYLGVSAVALKVRIETAGK
jgi:IrrE N-terminal-like domain